MTLRRVIELTCVLLFLGSIGYWLYDIRQAQSRLQPLALANPPQAGDIETWYGIYYDERKIGYSGTRIHFADTGLTTIANESLMRLVTASVLQTLRISSTATIDQNGAMRSFSVDYSAGPAQARIDGQVAPREIVLTIASPSGDQRITLPIKEKPRFPLFMRRTLARQNPARGATFIAETFDPLSMASRPMTITILDHDILQMPDGTSFSAIQLKEQVPGLDIVTTAWVDTLRGTTLKEVSPLGFISWQEPKEKALTGLSDAPVDLIAGLSLRPDPRFISRLSKAKQGVMLDSAEQRAPTKRMVVRLEGLPEHTQALALTGGRQVKAKEILSITLENEAVYRAPAYPYQRIPQHVRHFLKPGKLEQSDHPAIKAAVQKALGAHRPRNALDAVRILARFVRDHVDDAFVASLPSAVAVLENAQGDCNEHAVLFVALCRAAGIPARQVAGVAFMGTGASGLEPAFYYHAWAEVYLNGWVTVDPTWGQLPADVTHIRLVSGSIADQAGIASVMGKLSFDIIEVEE